MAAGTYYRYVDADGAETIVSDLQDVPAQLRSEARRVELPGRPEREAVTRNRQGVPDIEVAYEAPAAGTAVASPPGGAGTIPLHWPSAAIGLLVGLAMALAVSARRRSARLARLVGAGVLVASAAALYLGLLRGAVGLGTGPLATPASIVKDARDAAAAAGRSGDAQREALRQLDAQGR